MSARTSPRQSRRALVTGLGLGLAAVLGLSSCGATEPTSAATVTVWVDPPAPTPTPTPTSVSSATPSPTTSTPTPATTLTAGHLNRAITSYAQALERFDGVSSKRYSSFTSPSRNIYCTFDSAGAACELREGRITPPADGICPADGPKDIGRLELGAAGVTPMCNSDSIRDGDAPKLPYGRLAEVPGSDIRCLSEEWGVTCIDPRTQHGFWIAKGSFATF